VARAVIEASAEVTVPVRPQEAYDALTDLEHAVWLPGIRGLRHIGGPARGVGARYEVEAGLVGRHLRGVLVCTEAVSPRWTVVSLEEGLDLTITATVTRVNGGCRVELAARYSVGAGLAAMAIERASAGPARREVARAVEQFAAQFARRSPRPQGHPARSPGGSPASG
jgi:carbon monoxide dehydrogenase subunit G